MIIKKPYAFLIKYFKIIHLVLSLLLILLVIKTNNILRFFNDYVLNGFFTYKDNLSASYIPIYLFIIIIFVVLISFVIYLLMKWKNKNKKLYTFICIFYLLLFILFIIYSNVFNVIDNSVLDMRSIRTYRDVILIFTIVQYFFIIISIIRSLGFNVKHFNFKKDLKELNIETKDAEEVEIVVNKDLYKVKRGFRKTLREFSYYIRENKIFFYVLLSLCLIGIIIMFYININITNKKYNQKEYFNVNGIIFNVESSFITDRDYAGQIINKDKSYIILSTIITNNSKNKIKLKNEDLRVTSNNKNYYPKYSFNNYFIDLGEGYNNDYLSPGEKNKYLFVYEIDSKYKNNQFLFKVMSSVGENNGQINSNFKTTKLNLINLSSIKTSEIYNLNENINLNESSLKNSGVIINYYNINNIFNHKYRYCVYDTCYDGEKIIKPGDIGPRDRSILKLEAQINIDKNLYISKYLITPSDFINMFGSITYTLDSKNKTSNISVIISDTIKGKEIYAEIPSEVINANEIILNLNIRNMVYRIKLK